MTRRLLNVLAVVSLLLCVATAVLWHKSYNLGDSFGWGVHNKENTVYDRYEVDSLNGSVSFGGFEMRFDNSPFQHGGDIGFTWHSNMSNVGHRGWFQSGSPLIRFGFDAYDVVTVGRGGSWTDWGVILPCWLVVLLLGVAPVMWGVRCYRCHQRRRQPMHGRCSKCGYDLRATPDRCPECGLVMPSGTPTELLT